MSWRFLFHAGNVGDVVQLFERIPDYETMLQAQVNEFDLFTPDLNIHVNNSGSSHTLISQYCGFHSVVFPTATAESLPHLF